MALFARRQGRQGHAFPPSDGTSDRPVCVSNAATICPSSPQLRRARQGRRTVTSSPRSTRDFLSRPPRKRRPTVRPGEERRRCSVAAAQFHRLRLSTRRVNNRTSIRPWATKTSRVPSRKDRVRPDVVGATAAPRSRSSRIGLEQCRRRAAPRRHNVSAARRKRRSHRHALLLVGAGAGAVVVVQQEQRSTNRSQPLFGSFCKHARRSRRTLAAQASGLRVLQHRRQRVGESCHPKCSPA